MSHEKIKHVHNFLKEEAKIDDRMRAQSKKYTNFLLSLCDSFLSLFFYPTTIYLWLFKTSTVHTHMFALCCFCFYFCNNNSGSHIVTQRFISIYIYMGTLYIVTAVEH